MHRIKDPETLSSNLDWKEFEAFAESAFSTFNFKTRRNVRFRKPRVEIDLVASKNALTFAVDCKHWKRTVGHASILAVSRRQISRAKRLVQEENHRRVIPLIVTLHDESLYILENGVPIVPIHKISDFILNWEGALDEIAIITNENQKRKFFVP